MLFILTAGLLPSHSFFFFDEVSLRVGEVSLGEKMLYSGTDPQSYITECTSVYEKNRSKSSVLVQKNDTQTTTTFFS